MRTYQLIKQYSPALGLANRAAVTHYNYISATLNHIYSSWPALPALISAMWTTGGGGGESPGGTGGGRTGDVGGPGEGAH